MCERNGFDEVLGRNAFPALSTNQENHEETRLAGWLHFGNDRAQNVGDLYQSVS